MSDRSPTGRPWPVLSIGRVLALLVLLLALIALFVPAPAMGPHLTLILIVGLALAILL